MSHLLHLSRLPRHLKHKPVDLCLKNLLEQAHIIRNSTCRGKFFWTLVEILVQLMFNFNIRTFFMNLIFDMSCIMCNWLITDGYRCVFCALGKINRNNTWNLFRKFIFRRKNPQKNFIFKIVTFVFH